ncbi:MAG: methylmalonyl-CoA mutase small subunit [Bacteroidaceae bacterium]|nr:methylmalonyl-CoA mutase small subunit [Bacteroidaceae bacterium]
MSNNKEKLFSEFPPVSTEEWMAKITEDLKGADFEKKLVWRTNEGFKVQPFYRQENLEGLDTETKPGEFPYKRGTKADNSWYVRQNLSTKDVKEANTKALDILNKGVDSLNFCCCGRVLEETDLEVLLEGICAECIDLNFRISPALACAQAEALVAYFTTKGYDLDKLHGSIVYDPMSFMMRKGVECGLDDACKLIEILEPLKKYRALTVGAGILSDCGAFCYQELGYALAWGNEYMRSLTEAGADAAKVAKKIQFNLGISSNYFMEIAKFRAARMLWAKIVEAYKPVCTCGKNPEDGICRCSCKMVINATTSKYNQTIFDPYVNLLRSETEAMSAALAGVNSITVTPFDAAYQKSDEFSERMARNQQLLLKEESHFDKVVDPAGGSYYIENLTEALAEQAWKLFLQIEDEGGMLALIRAGKVQEAVNATNATRHENAAKRKEALLGTNQFPNIKELSEGRTPKTCGSKGCCCQAEAEPTIATLDTSRIASQFEELRLQTEASGRRPKVFMLTIGNLAMRQARAQFSGNFFGCAGYEIIDNLGFKTVEEGAEAARKAGADIVVLCSSDDEYAEYGPAAFKAVGDSAIFVIAGNPACIEDLKAAGIENYVHVRCNVLETLRDFNSKLNIK